MPGTLKIRDVTTGVWEEISTAGPMGQRGPIGPLGPTGPQGEMGISTILIGDFSAPVASLPVDGLIPADFNGPGDPAAPYQMEPGQSLIYSPVDIDDPGFGETHQFVTQVAEPSGWLNIGRIVGPLGPTGPTGPTGPQSDDVHIGPSGPPLIQTELWFDTDDTRILGPIDLPTGGTVDQALVKASDIDGDVEWGTVIDQGGGTFTAGAKLQFHNEEGPKINLYGSTFGLGITASTLAFYSGGVFRFRRDSTTGTEFAYIDSNGMGPRLTYTVTFANGFSGTMDFRVNPVMVTCRMTNLTRNANTELNAQTKVCDYPAGVPAPPMMGAGYRTIAKERNANFSSDNPARFVTIHLDSTGVWIIPTGDVFYSGKYLDAMVTWSR